MTNEDYNGWVNRETWCFNLYLRNDQDLYYLTKQAAERGIRRMNDMQCEYPELTLKPDLFIGESILEFMSSLYDDMREAVQEGLGLISDTDRGMIVHANVSELFFDRLGATYADFKLAELVSMFHDIGSLWRVDLAEIGESWAEDLEDA
tara:strand:+ start:681 stop:1127 length:447 start_codon:yes stop_codon:yes gene_type:complete